MVGYRCMNCMWYDNIHESLKTLFGDDKHGFCRKHKPASIFGKAYCYGVWPVVTPNDLCGEFRQDEKNGLPK